MRLKRFIYRLVGCARTLAIKTFHNIKNWWLKRSFRKYKGVVEAQLLIDDESPTCLCAIQYSLSRKAIPQATGYIFQTYPQSDSCLYYSDSLEGKPRRVAKVNFSLSEYNIAISPSGIMIATPIAKRGEMYVIKEGVEIELFCNRVTSQPCGWLYNTGIDFVLDGQGKECCIFAEYGHTEKEYYVWRGECPYNDESLWQKVLVQESEKEIHHFHQIKRDPWTGYLYLTSGDNGEQNKWWYSKDSGKTFTLFNSAKICNCAHNVLRIRVCSGSRR